MTSVTDISDSMPNQMVEGSPKLKLNAESPNDSDNIMFENNVDINNKSSAHTSAGNGNRDYNHMQCIISVEANEAVGYADELSHSSGSSGKAISGCNFVEVSEDLIGPCDTSRRRDTLAVTCLNDVGERFERKEESRDLRIFEEGDSSNKGETSQLGLNCKEDNIDKLMPETFDSLEDSRVCQNLNERNSCKKGGRSQLGFDRKEEERDCEKFNKTDSGYKSEGLCERFDSKEDISNCQNSETDSSHKDDRFQLELDVKENNRDGKAFKETDSGYRNIGLCERHDSKEVCSDYQEFDETDSHDKSKRSQLGFDGKDDNRDHNERDSGYKKEGLFQQSDLNLQKVQDFANEQSESGSDKRHNSIYQQGNMAPDKGQDMSLVDILQKPCAPSFRNGLLTSSIQEAVREKKCVSSEQCDSPSDRGSIREDTVPSGSTHHDVSELPDIDCDLTRSATQGSKASNKHGGDNAHNVTAKISARKKMKIMKRIAMVKGDGTVEVDVVGSARYALGLFGTSVEAQQEEYETKGRDEGEKWTLPPLQIAMLIVGTRGDVQPFLAIGKHLQEYGHRVRLATHSNFEDFVLTTGLEFYPLGGDPKILAEYMVKNKGFLPSGPSEIAIQRKQIKAIINSLLPACTDSYGDSGRPFRAQAIIANPPAYGHVHVAEALQVPLHIFFTMPWTPTSEFPHPLSRVKQSAGYWLSYQVVDSLIWLGIRDIINDFRKKKLKLRPVTYLSGKQGSITDLPTAYIWSPHLVPKPKDWGPKVDVVGFCFLDLAANYKPPESLVKWLEAGEKPIYVGFGSLPVQEPERMTKIIVQALEETGQRGIINKGWGGLGNLAEPVDFVYLLDNCPHDWLFPHCAAVVHHGGAGTTAAGLKAACPTTVVPFFGDQPFWGERVHARGVGPMPIPVDQFSLDKLVPAINFMLDRKVKERALDLAKAIENEDGVSGAVKAFHKQLPRNMPQALAPPMRTDLFKSCFGHIKGCFA